MKAEYQKREMSSQEIEQHLKSAVDALAPDIFDRLDLSVPQQKPRPDDGREKIVSLQRRMRGMAVAAAACLCLVTAGGGAWHYQYQNRQIDSVIGIDVNPSVELSISRKNRILKAEPLNADAESIMEDMDLKGVELNVAVNAVIGSMVIHGYLDDLDNAILVTVSNDSIKKATALRSSVVEDIEQTLQENQVKAVVYDQQVIEEDAARKLADTYGISYGKAYFLKELISQNENLTEADMRRLSTMNMEEIAREIAKDSLNLGEFADKAKSPQDAESGNAQHAETIQEAEKNAESSTGSEAEGTGISEEMKESSAAAESISETETSAKPETEPETDEEIRQGRVKIDYVDYEDGSIYIYFEDYVRWKNPTVSVRDEDGNSYSAMVDETESDSCIVEVSGLEDGKTYSFVLGGITRKGDSTATTVKGYFDAPEIADELKSSEASDEDTEETEHDQENSQTRHPNAESETGTSTETPDEKQTSEGSAKMTEAKQQETEDAKTSIESSTQKDTDNGGGQN